MLKILENNYVSEETLFIRHLNENRQRVLQIKGYLQHIKKYWHLILSQAVKQLFR